MAPLAIDILNEEAANEEFADTLNFSPTYPTHDTQPARLLAVNLLGNKVNPLWGWVRLGIYRLSDTKFRLKEMGWPMETGRLDVANKFGELCHVALYGLPQWAIDIAGEHGQAFAQNEMALMRNRRAAKFDELANGSNATEDQAKWYRYESLKARYGAEASSQSEYEAACHRAAQEAGV